MAAEHLLVAILPVAILLVATLLAAILLAAILLEAILLEATHSSISGYLEKALDTTRQTKFRSAGRSLSEDSALERCLP